MESEQEYNGQEHKRWYRRPRVWILGAIGILVLFAGGSFTYGFFKAYFSTATGGPPLAEFAEQTSDAGLSQQGGGGEDDVVTADDPRLGNEAAQVVIVGFEDFECPFCARAFPIMRELMSLYSDRILFIYRDFPLTTVHPNAFNAALAAECAHEQEKFWEYHDKLFVSQHDLSKTALKRYATLVNLDTRQFNTCLDSQKYASEVQADFDAGRAAGVTGTPTWFINGQKISGVVPLEAWKTVLNALLQQ